MLEEQFKATLEEFSTTGKVSNHVVDQFTSALTYILNRNPYYYEDADSDCTEEDQFSLYNIERIKSGVVFDVDLAEYIKDVVDEFIENIEEDDFECGTDYRKDLGWN